MHTSPGQVPPAPTRAGTEGKRAVGGAHGRGRGVTPAPGLAPLSDGGCDKAGQGSATPNRGGAAPIPAPLPGLRPCLFPVFKLFQSAGTRETFGKQLLISRAESVSFICEEGKRSARTWWLGRPSSGHPARPPPPTGTAARGPFQPRDREPLASGRAGVGDFRRRSPRPGLRTGRALAPPSGGREAWRGCSSAGG